MDLLLINYQNPLEYLLNLTKPWFQFYLNSIECLQLKIPALIYLNFMNIIILTLSVVSFSVLLTHMSIKFRYGTIK